MFTRSSGSTDSLTDGHIRKQSASDTEERHKKYSLKMQFSTYEKDTVQIGFKVNGSRHLYLA